MFTQQVKKKNLSGISRVSDILYILYLGKRCSCERSLYQACRRLFKVALYSSDV